MAANYDALINEKQAQLESLKSMLEEIKQQFIKDSVIFIREWYKITTENYVKTAPDITISLGKEKLKQMKEKVAILIQNAESIANEFLSNPDLWWHLKEISEHRYSYYGNRAPDDLDKALRLSLGKLGVILEEFGYNVTTKSTYRDQDNVWVEWDSSGQYHPPNGRPYYPYGMDWSDMMRITIGKYNEVFVQAMKIREEIRSLQGEKKRQQAQNLWDSI